MKTNVNFYAVLLPLSAFQLFNFFALATLTVTITPGYEYRVLTGPRAATLTVPGTPTATITGTVDGSTGLSAGSVSGTLLADSVPDGVTLHYNGASPRQLAVLSTGLFDGSGGITASN